MNWFLGLFADDWLKYLKSAQTPNIWRNSSFSLSVCVKCCFKETTELSFSLNVGTETSQRGKRDVVCVMKHHEPTGTVLSVGNVSHILGQDPKILELKVQDPAFWRPTFELRIQLDIKTLIGSQNLWVKEKKKGDLHFLPPPPPCPSVASFVFWLLVTPFNMGQIASAWQILGSPAAPLLGGGGWGGSCVTVGLV